MAERCDREQGLIAGGSRAARAPRRGSEGMWEDGHVECRPRLCVHDHQLVSSSSVPPAHLSRLQALLMICLTDQYALGSIILERANNLPHQRCKHGRYVPHPAFRSLLSPDARKGAGNVSAARDAGDLCAMAHSQGGRDASLCRAAGAGMSSAEVHDFDPALGSALRVALENNGRSGLVGAASASVFPGRASSVSTSGLGLATARPRPWRSTHERPLLASMIFDLYHARNTMPLRARHLRPNCGKLRAHLRYQRPVAASLSAFPLPVQCYANARAITNATRNAHAITSPHPGALCQTLTMS